MGDPFLAELERERFGDFREVRREQYRHSLPLPVDGPRDWLRRQALLLDALEDIPQDYRRGCPQTPHRTSTVKRGRETKTVRKVA